MPPFCLFYILFLFLFPLIKVNNSVRYLFLPIAHCEYGNDRPTVENRIRLIKLKRNKIKNKAK